MTRFSYKLALRAKGFKPLPKTVMRSSVTQPRDKEGRLIETICATTAALVERSMA